MGDVPAGAAGAGGASRGAADAAIGIDAAAVESARSLRSLERCISHDRGWMAIPVPVVGGFKAPKPGPRDPLRADKPGGNATAGKFKGQPEVMGPVVGIGDLPRAATRDQHVGAAPAVGIGDPPWVETRGLHEGAARAACSVESNGRHVGECPTVMASRGITAQAAVDHGRIATPAPLSRDSKPPNRTPRIRSELA